jgi:hypothetical protein
MEFKVERLTSSAINIDKLNRYIFFLRYEGKFQLHTAQPGELRHWCHLSKDLETRVSEEAMEIKVAR